MKYRISSIGMAALVAIGLSTSSVSAVDVGDTPNLQFRSTDGRMVNLQDLRGQLVLVDFWATWCGPCMRQSDHKLQIHEKYADQGLVMVGVSLDQSQANLNRVVREKRFTWPQYFDGRGWQNRYAQQWGVRSIPTAFLISPDGTVLWKGQPIQADRAIQAAFETHPPQLVDPQVLAENVALLDQIESALEQNRQGEAIKLLAKVNEEAMKDPEFADRAEAIQQQVRQAADELLAGVDPLIEQGNYTEAAARLRDIAQGLRRLPVGNEASRRLSSLMARPEVRAQIEEMQKNERATELLAVARKHQADGRHDVAYARFREIARGFAGTDAAEIAAREVKTYEQDQEFARQALEKAAEDKAKAALSMAHNYMNAGRHDLARQRYQAIVDEFPGTSFAEDAEAQMAKLRD